MAELTIAELVRRCRSGDNQAWADLVARTSRYVYAIAVQAYRLSQHDTAFTAQDLIAPLEPFEGASRSVEELRS